MSEFILRALNVGKAFREYGSEWRRMAGWFGFPVKPLDETWVLSGVTFALARGEAVGIVGQNGAGKSTLLKMITGTTRPTTGSVEMHGRIAAILELGMGFNPDLSGRQNAVHSAGLMGYQLAEIEQAMPDIEAFAEIGEYFDQPVRTYSSGMQMRVAFSVATAFRPDLLIVDEALSVGDSYFQHKCFKRIREFREQGTSLLIVSHDSGAIQNLCDRAILLDGGKLIKDGVPSEVMDLYNALIAERENSEVKVLRLDDGKEQVISGTGEVVVEQIALRDAAGKPIEFATVGQPVRLWMRAKVHGSVERLVFGYMIKDRLGQTMFGTNTHHTNQALDALKEGQHVEFTAAFSMNLGPGTYSVSTALVSTDTHLVNNYEWRDLALVFDVANLDRDTFIGLSWLPPVFQITAD